MTLIESKLIFIYRGQLQVELQYASYFAKIPP